MRITMEMIQKSFEMAQEAPRREPMLIVSHRAYKEAERAVAEGASERVISLCLAGATYEQALEYARDLLAPVLPPSPIAMTVANHPAEACHEARIKEEGEDEA